VSVCGRSLTEIVGSKSPGGDGYLSVVSVVWWQVEVSATSWSLFQSSPTKCGASLNMIWKPRKWGGPGPLGGGAVAPKTNELCVTDRDAIETHARNGDLAQCTLVCRIRMWLTTLIFCPLFLRIPPLAEYSGAKNICAYC